MYSDFFLVEKEGVPTKRAIRLPFGDTAGRNEAWLRDTLFSNPQIVPIRDIDPSFGPLLPLCRELRTEAGPLDIAFISPTGRLTLVECKLWRNPEARRKVVAQVLDYARAISHWSYSDLQRQVSIATGRQGNIAFDLAKTADPTLVEHHFADAVVRAMRSGQFLLLIAGDGIREDVGALAELINRNAASGFSLGLVEVALYDLGEDGLAVQPRVTARTEVIKRNVVIVQDGGSTLLRDQEPEIASYSLPSTTSVAEAGDPDDNPENDGSGYDNFDRNRRWWKPVLDMSFDDPDQEPLSFIPSNIVRSNLPWPRTWITAYRNDGQKAYGVYLSGHQSELRELFRIFGAEIGKIVEQLPEGTKAGNVRASGGLGVMTTRPYTYFANDYQTHAWLKETINDYVNVFRPRLKQLVS
jgi:hypothetical protein